jgi:hypothetical protein
MLDLNSIKDPEAYDAGIWYYGADHYHITQDRTGYAVHVEMLDEDGNATPGETYAASSLSTAIAVIERLEAGEAE